MLAKAEAPLYIDGDGDRQRDLRTSNGPLQTDKGHRPPGDPLAGGSDRAGHWPGSAVLRRQESRLLDFAVDRLERVFLPALAVRLRQQHGMDVADPHSPADSHRL